MQRRRRWGRASATTETSRAAATTPSTRPAQPDVPTDATQPAQPDVRPGRERLRARRLAGQLRRLGQRRLVRVRAGRPAAALGPGDDHDARLLRVRGLRPAPRAHPPHGAHRQHRRLPPLADRRGRAVPRPGRHRAVHHLGRRRHPRRARPPRGRPRPRAARPRPGQLLRLLVRRDPHRQPREPPRGPRASRCRGRSSSTTRTTAGWPARRAGARRLAGRHPVVDPGRVPLGAEGVISEPEGRRQLQRRLPEARPHPRRQQGPGHDPPRRPRPPAARRRPRCVRLAARHGRRLRLGLLLEGLGRPADRAAEDGTDRAYALGDTPEQRSIGAWSDGVAIAPLVVRDEAPLRP